MLLRLGGKLFLLCFFDEEPGDQGSRREIEDMFAKWFLVEKIEASGFEVRSDMKQMKFSSGVPKAWFVVAKRRE